MDVVEHRATCVGDVGGVHEATREHPYEPGVHGAEEQLACIRPLAGAGDVSQDPRDLAGREVRIGEKSRLGANPIADLGRPADLVDERRRAPALPYDGVIDGLACGGIPHDGGLALVVDADGINLRRRETVPVHEFGERADLREEDVLRVVLDPAGLWEDLLERSLHAVDHDISRAVASSSSPEQIAHHLRVTDVERYFTLTVSGKEVTHTKPRPDIFLECARRMEVEPGRTLVLEDSYNGVRAGAAGGFITVMVPDLAESDDEMRSLCARCCSSLFEVRDLLSSGEIG